MKQGGFRALRFAVCLILMAGIAVLTAYADDNTVDFSSIVLESFNNNPSHEWTVGSTTHTYDFTWAVDASKFASTIDNESFPKLSYVPSWPLAFYGTNREGKDIQSLGIWGKFDRRGYNWIDIYPVSGDNNDPFEIPIPGRVSYLDLWIWGSNLQYYIEVYLRDYQGVVHNLYLGNLAFQGWKNLRVQVPTSIPQSRRTLPRVGGLSFVKFRIWTTPMERVDNFYIYLNQFKVLTDTFNSMFDGDELADPERVQELWANNN
ncbi:MAG: flagellar filament outer layer protein FlaA [Treponema sp.]|nr:flagellar filament outer layer protein FlaA [Treponema sp.]